MGLPTIQPSFATGEMSPALFGRIDLAKFHSACALLRNFFVDYRGGVSNRAGTRFVGRCLPGINREIPFTFSTLQTYNLVFSDRAMRVVMNGGLVLEAALPVGNSSQEIPCRIFFVAPATWNVGDWIYLTGLVDGGGVPIPRLTGFFTVLGISVGNWVRLGDLDGNAIDSTSLPVGVNGAVARVYTLATPFAAADLALVKFTQSADTMTLTHPAYAPQQLTRTGHAAWTILPANFVPTAATPVAGSAVPSMVGDGTLYRYVVTAILANGTESLPSAAMEAVNSKTMSATANALVTVTWTDYPTAVMFNVYRQPEVAANAPQSGELYGFVGAIARNQPQSGGGFTPQFNDSNIAPDFSRTPPQNYNPFAGAQNPACCAYWQQREWFAGADATPETFYGSKTADFLNFGYSEPARANDSIQGTIVAREVNAIKHLVPMDSLLALSGKGAWKIDSGAQGGPVTPSSIDANPQAYNGCSDVPPIAINQDLLYVQAKGSTVRDLTWNFYVKVYTGSDLTVLAAHLFSGHRILEWAWAEEPHKVIWAVRDDGVLLAFTFLKEQEIYGWAHCDTDGQFKSVCSISEGDEDAVYFIVERPQADGTRVQFIERLASRQLGSVPEYGVPADWSKFWFVDCGLSSPLNYPAGALTPLAKLITSDDKSEGWWAAPSVVGAVVTVAGAGYVAPTATVVDGIGRPIGTLTLTLAAGVITAAVPVAPILDVEFPDVSVVIADVAGGGSGAVIFAQLSRDVDMRCDNAVLGGVLIGDLVLVNGGFGHVRVVQSARVVTVNMEQPMASANPAIAGDWSITTPVSSVSGLDHLEGKTVAILADGNVHPSQVVANGTVHLQSPAAAIVVGLPYVADFESLPLDVPAEPTVQGRRKVINAITTRVADTRGLKVAHGREPFVEFKERDYQPMGTAVKAFDGDRRAILNAEFTVLGQLRARQDYPLPATILALIPEVGIGDTQ